MRNPTTWICPGCGRTVTLPPDYDLGGAGGDRRRLDQLAQALCGCWVNLLPSGGVTRFIAAILAGNESDDDQNLSFSRGDA